MDLILCRNVFIYFNRTAVTRVISKFTNTLKSGGYLITGHAELHDQKPSGLSVQAFPESIVYRRDNARCGAETRPLRSGVTRVTSMAPTMVLHRAGNHRHAVAIPRPRTSASPLATVPRMATPPSVKDSFKAQAASADDLYNQARGYADVGHYEAAIHSCQLALTRDALAEKPYYLLAQIAEVQGNLEAAKNFLKKVLYLAPASVAAHLELGALYAKEHDLARAWKLLNGARELLQALPADAVIEPFANLSAAQLLPEVHRRIEQLSYTPSGLS
jgi:chemotaxis protein methyltransferase CheR